MTQADQLPTTTTSLRLVFLGFLSLATILLIPLKFYLPGVACLLAAVACMLRDGDRTFTRRMSVLLCAIVILTLAPINTDTDDQHFMILGTLFAVLVLGPAVFFLKTDPSLVRFRFLPPRFRWLDVFYVAISVPMAYYAIKYYFHFNPDMPTQWSLPAQRDSGQSWRLIIGINAVGLWDELFFVNTVFVILRSVFPLRWANLAQAVVYTAVLNDMAFLGLGPLLIYYFALTQGSMMEKSGCLLYVLLVHVLVDVFLLEAIFAYYYPA